MGRGKDFLLFVEKLRESLESLGQEWKLGRLFLSYIHGYEPERNRTYGMKGTSFLTLV